MGFVFVFVFETRSCSCALFYDSIFSILKFSRERLTLMMMKRRKKRKKVSKERKNLGWNLFTSMSSTYALFYYYT